MSFINFNAIKTSNVNIVEIKVDFLGSSHYAYKTVNAGKSYDGTKHIYEKDEIIKNENKWKVKFTFSGPTTLDIKEPTIKSVTAKGKKTLEDFLKTILKTLKEIAYSKNIFLHIKGHSRGAIIAKNVYDYLKSKFSSQITFEKLELADPYAGPLNRLAKKVDTFEDEGQKDINIVYSLTEKRFASPSKALNANIVVFTDISHDKTQYISSYIAKNHFDRGTYYFKGKQSDIKKWTTPISRLNKEYLKPKKTDDEIEKIENEIKKIKKGLGVYIEKNLSRIETQENCSDCLACFKKFGSADRRKIYYKRLAGINQSCKNEVLKHLQGKNYPLLKKEIEKIKN